MLVEYIFANNDAFYLLIRHFRHFVIILEEFREYALIRVSAKRYGKAYTKTSRIWKEVLDGTSGNLLPSWESEEQRQIRIARGLAEHYNARSRKELQGLYNGIAALSALSPHLKKDERLVQLQSETAKRLRQPKPKQ